MGCQGAFYLISVFLLSMAYISSSFHEVLHTPSNLEQLSMLRKIDDILPQNISLPIPNDLQPHPLRFLKES